MDPENTILKNWQNTAQKLKKNVSSVKTPPCSMEFVEKIQSERSMR